MTNFRRKIANFFYGIGGRKYQSLTYTSEEKARQPYFDPITLGRLKGAKLAEDVLLDILSVITEENFGDAILTRNAADFDTDDKIGRAHV